jgi:hypothetical protein
MSFSADNVVYLVSGNHRKCYEKLVVKTFRQRVQPKMDLTPAFLIGHIRPQASGLRSRVRANNQGHEASTRLQIFWVTWATAYPLTNNHFGTSGLSKKLLRNCFRIYGLRVRLSSTYTLKKLAELTGSQKLCQWSIFCLQCNDTRCNGEQRVRCFPLF